MQCDILELRENHWLFLGINFGVSIYASLFLKAKLLLESNKLVGFNKISNNEEYIFCL